MTFLLQICFINEAIRRVKDDRLGKYEYEIPQKNNQNHFENSKSVDFITIK